MRKQIINNHTIKVFITKVDLKRNGITALDLLGDHNQIEAFFYKILNEVDTAHILRPNEPLTFRVLPNQKGLDIIISNHRSVNSLQRPQRTNVSTNQKTSLSKKIIQLNSFEDFIQIANSFRLDKVGSSLYRYDDEYCLELDFHYNLIHGQIDRIKDQLAMVYEYGKPAPFTPEQLTLKGKAIMKGHALEKARYYFH